MQVILRLSLRVNLPYEFLECYVFKCITEFVGSDKSKDETVSCVFKFDCIINKSVF